MGGVLVEAPLASHLVVKEHLAVIAGKEDQSMVQKAIFTEGAQHQAYLVVNVRALGKIRPLGQPDLIARPSSRSIPIT